MIERQLTAVCDRRDERVCLETADQRMRAEWLAPDAVEGPSMVEADL